MDKFVGRKEELLVLEREYKRGEGFVVIYGRRRVGKTTLIREFIRGKDAFYFLATEELERENIKNFTRGLARYSGREYIAGASFNDWEGVFEEFVRCRSKARKVLVIDEFTYLIGVNPAFASIFQKIWDTILRASGVMVILCGSLTGMMTRHVLSYSSPLYGRRTAQIRLAPLSFAEAAGFFPGRSFEDKVLLYSVTGGVPKYIEFFANGRTLMDNIESEILSRHGFLYEEPSFLLEKEVGEITSYFSIIKTIASGEHRLGSIAGALGLPATRLTPYLKVLMDLDVIEKRVPATERAPEKSRKGLYFIKDNFIRFWFAFVAPDRSELEIGYNAGAVRRIRANLVDGHASFVFEDISRETLGALLAGRRDAPSFEKIGSYWTGETEIDICAVSQADRTALLGECKFIKKPVDAGVYNELIKKAEKIPELKGFRIIYAIFSKSGFTDRMRLIAEKANGGVILVDKGAEIKRG